MAAGLPPSMVLVVAPAAKLARLELPMEHIAGHCDGLPAPHGHPYIRSYGLKSSTRLAMSPPAASRRARLG